MSSTLVVPSSRTLLAYGIAEWTAAIEHLRAVGTVIYVPAQSVQTLVAERRILLWRWEDSLNRFRPISAAVEAEVIAEARAHLTEHQAEIDLIEMKVEERQ